MRQCRRLCWCKALRLTRSLDRNHSQQPRCIIPPDDTGISTRVTLDSVHTQVLKIIQGHTTCGNVDRGRSAIVLAESAAWQIRARQAPDWARMQAAVLGHDADAGMELEPPQPRTWNPSPKPEPQAPAAAQVHSVF